MDIQDKTTADVREGNPPNAPASEGAPPSAETTSKPAEGEPKPNDRSQSNTKVKKDKSAAKQLKSKHKKSKKQLRVPDSSSEDTDTASDDTSSDSESETTDSESESEHDTKKKRGSKKRVDSLKSKKKAKGRRHRKSSKSQRQTTGSDSDLDSDYTSDVDHSDKDDSRASQRELSKQLPESIRQLQQLLQHTDQTYTHGGNSLPPPSRRHGLGDAGARLMDTYTRGGARQRDRAGFGRNPLLGLDDLRDGRQKPSQMDKKRHKASMLDFKRVDQVWDNTIHNYKLQDTAERTTDAQYDEFLFHVRRTFDWEGKFKATVVDIKSKLLRESLQEVMGNIKGVSLVEETPKLDPNMLFLYLDDLRTYAKQLKNEQPSSENKKERKKERKRIESKRQHLKVLIKYINKDYADVKNR